MIRCCLSIRWNLWLHWENARESKTSAVLVSKQNMRTFFFLTPKRKIEEISSRNRILRILKTRRRKYPKPLLSKQLVCLTTWLKHFKHFRLSFAKWNSSKKARICHGWDKKQTNYTSHSIETNKNLPSWSVRTKSWMFLYKQTEPCTRRIRLLSVS